MINKKCDVQAKEKFVERMNTYLDRISTGKRNAKEFLGSDLAAFFNGYHVPCPGHDRNIHKNLNINITKPKQDLETSSFFSRTTERIKEEKSEVKRVKIYSNNKRILTIEKNDKQQRNYSFTKEATCKLEISWSTKDEPEQGANCTVVLNINSGPISIGKSIIGGKDVEPKKILELAMKNEAVLIEGKALHESFSRKFN
ncbi:hypothetical protein [Wolbachia pipientis]|uniref:hypothetical protein n=1 Tax=Wolbachia pipientis TaxID=955 RepID=UPI0025A3E95D|nr:hypothetical protein [Wolbachia pipientis]